MALGMKHSTSPAADRITPLAITVVITGAITTIETVRYAQHRAEVRRAVHPQRD